MPGSFPGWIASVVHEFSFDRAEAAFHRGVVPTISLAAHRLNHPGFIEDLSVISGSILAAAGQAAAFGVGWASWPKLTHVLDRCSLTCQCRCATSSHSQINEAPFSHARPTPLSNILRTMATPELIKDWSMTTLKEKLIKIGAKVVAHGRYVAFQMAEVAIPRNLFADILQLIAELRPPPNAAME